MKKPTNNTKIATMTGDLAMRPAKKRKGITWRKLFVLIGIGYLLYIFADQERQLTILRREAENLRANESTLQVENDRLKQERQLLQTPAYIEKVAREELGLVKPGETPYMMGQQTRGQ